MCFTYVSDIQFSLAIEAGVLPKISRKTDDLEILIAFLASSISHALRLHYEVKRTSQSVATQSL